jgi:tRNA threonylcarbamoyladenosine biosynthesis protein TsaB
LTGIAPSGAAIASGVRLIEGPVLGLEATGTLAGVALFLRGRLVGEIAQDARASSAEQIVEQTSRLLRAHSLRPRELSRVGVALGPGSFTGLRVGLAAARGLAMGAEIAAVGVPSHQALAWPWRDLGRCIVLMSGLRRGQMFLEAGHWQGDDWMADLPGQSAPAEDLPAILSSLPEAGRLLFVGEAVESGCALHPELRSLGLFVEEPLSRIRRPAVIACMAARRAAAEWRGDELEKLEPLYLRGADARKPGTPAGRG